MYRRLEWTVVPVVTLALAMLVLTAPTAVAKDVTYSFNLLGPQTATNGTQTINVTGVGVLIPPLKRSWAAGSSRLPTTPTER
jgi:hypothetical protein